MRSVLKFGAALLAAVIAHLAMVRLAPDSVRFVDLFLVVVLYHALFSSPTVGMLYGLVAGLTADAVFGGPFGLFGIAGTVAGFAAGLVAQLVVIQRSTGAFGLFLAGAAVQQVALVLVVIMTFPRPVLPEGFSIAVKTVSTGLLGMLLFQTSRYLQRRYSLWRQGRPSKIRWSR